MTAKHRRTLFALLCFLIGMAALSALLPTGSGRIDREFRVNVEMDGILAALQQYKITFGENPRGDTAGIFRALRGDNPQKLVFFDGSPTSFTSNGALLDPWKTPYKIFISSNQIIIQSAGRNKHFDNPGNKDFDDITLVTNQ